MTIHEPIADEAESPDETPAAAPDETPAAEPRRPRTVVLALSALLAVSLAAAGWLGLQVRSDNQLDEARRQAVIAAQAYAVDLTTYDHTRLDADFARVLENSTGDFRAEYTAASESLRALIDEFKATATGTVLSTAVLGAETDHVDVLLFVDQTVENSNADEPRIDRSRMQMGLDKQDGRWLISSLDLL